MSRDDELVVAVEVAEFGERLMTFNFLGRVEEREILKARLTLVCISTQTGHANKIPDRVRTALSSPVG